MRGRPAGDRHCRRRLAVRRAAEFPLDRRSIRARLRARQSTDHGSVHQLVVPTWVVLVEQEPQESQRQYESGNPFADPFPDKHRHKPSRRTVFLDDTHADQGRSVSGLVVCTSARMLHVRERADVELPWRSDNGLDLDQRRPPTAARRPNVVGRHVPGKSRGEEPPSRQFGCDPVLPDWLRELDLTATCPRDPSMECVLWSSPGVAATMLSRGRRPSGFRAPGAEAQDPSGSVPGVASRTRGSALDPHQRNRARAG